MKGDFTRSTFSPAKHYTSVRMQQGRLQLDSDWNEQVDIQQHLQNAQAVDVIGSTSGVAAVDAQTGEATQDAFKLQVISNGRETEQLKTDLAILPGHLYTHGILCELTPEPLFSITFSVGSPNQIEVQSLVVDDRPFAKGQWLVQEDALAPVEQDETNSPPSIQGFYITHVDPVSLQLTLSGSLETLAELKKQESPRLRRIVTYTSQPDYPNPSPLEDKQYLAYLDVWQRHITALDDPTIREIALNVPDTTTRTKTVWQLKLQEFEGDSGEGVLPPSEWTKFLETERDRNPQLTASVQQSSRISTQLLTNQLYRVEIQSPSVDEKVSAEKQTGATFKWSRNNGVVVSVIRSIHNDTIQIKRSSQDAWSDSEPGQWIEIITEEMELKGEPGILAPLKRTSETKLEFDDARVRGQLTKILEPTTGKPLSPAKVRRWDYTTATETIQGAISVEQGDNIPLESSIKVTFQHDVEYRTGDYWLIPARSGSNDIDWPKDSQGRSIPQYRRGITHEFSLLAIIKPALTVEDKRTLFVPLSRALDKQLGGTIEGSLTVKGTFFSEILEGTEILKDGKPVALQESLDFHINQGNNPHKVTAAQIDVIDDNNKNLIVAQINAGDGTINAAKLDSTVALDSDVAAVQSSLDNHTALENNPHKVTAAQIDVIDDNNKNLIVAQINAGDGTINADRIDNTIARTSDFDNANISSLAIGLGPEEEKNISDNPNASDAKLYVKGNVYIDGDADSNQGSIFATNIKTKNVQAGRFLQLSSAAVKADITELEIAEAMEVFNQLSPVKFKYREDESNHVHAGFIAENTPDLLTSDDKKSVKLLDVVAVLTKALQQQEGTISQLNKIAHDQRKEIDHLAQKVYALETRRRIPWSGDPTDNDNFRANSLMSAPMGSRKRPLIQKFLRAFRRLMRT